MVASLRKRSDAVKLKKTISNEIKGCVSLSTDSPATRVGMVAVSMYMNFQNKDV